MRSLALSGGGVTTLVAVVGVGIVSVVSVSVVEGVVGVGSIHSGSGKLTV